ncbi:MAG TPA: sensor histidine kinase, partial [Pirellulales bacterium]|nr:sensor histidine kinase [Pirellulales bacterium]
MLRRSSLGWPITLAVVMIVLVVLLTIGWVIVTVIGALHANSPGVYWAVLAVGTTFLVLVLVGTILYLVLTIKEIRLNQRQSNFVDAVT